MDSIKYFLGSNTAEGFYSLYNGFVSLDEVFLWVIKGGAGCGKSSFMKRIGSAAEKADLRVEYALCSGDPNSVDGVYIPELKTAYVDGTAPHLIDTRLAAIDSAYIDLSRYYDIEGLEAHRAELEELKNGNSLSYTKAYALLSAAAAIKRGLVYKKIGTREKIAAESRIKGTMNRELGRKKANGKIVYRFLSAISCYGRVYLPETAGTLCRRFYHIKSRIGLAEYSIKTIAEAAAAAGHKIIVCPDSLTPEVPEAVLIPELQVAFVRDEKLIPEGAETHRINVDSKLAPALLRSLRPDMKFSEKITANLVEKAAESLSYAKGFHDEMENIYNPYVDFASVYSDADLHLARLGLDRI